MAELLSADSSVCYQWRDHSNIILHQIHKTLTEPDQRFVDVTLLVQDRSFPCHKVVLASASPYFRTMFSIEMEEARQKEIVIQGVSASAFDCLLTYIYTGVITISAENAQEIFEAANMFQILPLIDHCVGYISREMDIQNCFELMRLAEQFNCTSLHTVSRRFIVAKFHEVWQHNSFAELPLENVVDILKDRDLSVPDESVVFDAALHWLNAKPDRVQFLGELMSCVKFPMISASYINKNLLTHPIVSIQPGCMRLIQRALMYHMIPSYRNTISPYLITPRPRTGVTQEIVIVGGSDDTRSSSTVRNFNPHTSAWTELSGLPRHSFRMEYAVCLADGHIYVSGGSQFSRELWRYDVVLNGPWVECARMQRGRRRHALLFVGRSLYVCGGFDETQPLDSVERYHIPSNSWSDAGRLCHASMTMASAAYEEKIYLFGGFCDTECIGLTQCFDTTTNHCSLLEPLPLKAACISACVYGDRIYIIGNLGVLEYNIPLNSWDSIICDFTFPDYVGATVYNMDILVFGGRLNEGQISDKIFKFSPQDKTWNSVGTMPFISYTHGCVTALRYEAPGGGGGEAAIQEQGEVQAPLPIGEE